MRVSLRHFNSIKVRLEPSVAAIAAINPEFQFHKGAIRTSRKTKTSLWVSEFQFHKGAIRTCT